MFNKSKIWQRKDVCYMNKLVESLTVPFWIRDL